jgi:hypothetical protein
MRTYSDQRANNKIVLQAIPMFRDKFIKDENKKRAQLRAEWKKGNKELFAIE